MSNIKSVRNLRPYYMPSDEMAYSFNYKSDPSVFSFILRDNSTVNFMVSYRFTLTHRLESFASIADAYINKPTFFTI